MVINIKDLTFIFLKAFKQKYVLLTVVQAQYFQILSLHYFSERTDINSQPSAMLSLKASKTGVTFYYCWIDVIVNLLLERKCLSHALCFPGKLLQCLDLMQHSPAMSLLVNKKGPEPRVKVYRCPIPGNIQCQVEQESEQTYLGEDVPAHCRGVRDR